MITTWASFCDYRASRLEAGLLPGSLGGRGQTGQVLQSALDGRWDWGRSGQMVTGGLESVLIGDVLDGDHLAVGSGVRVRSGGDHGVLLGRNVLQRAGLLSLDSVSGLVRPTVRSVEVDLLLLAQNWDGLGGSLLLLGHGSGQNDEGGEHLERRRNSFY